MCTAKNYGSVFILAKDTGHFIQFLILLWRHAYARYALNDQVILSQCASFIEAANVDLACERDSPWLCAENLLLNQLDNRVVDGDGKLHGELGRHYIGDNQDASEHNLIP